MQVDPIKHILKALGTKRLKLQYDGPLSNFAFKFDLRRYKLAASNNCLDALKYLIKVGRSRLTL